MQRYFAPARASQQLDDALAERDLRFEDAQRRAPRIAVRRVVEIWPIWPTCLARCRPTAEHRNAAHAWARRRRVSRAGRAGPPSPQLAPVHARLAQRRVAGSVSALAARPPPA